MHIALLLAAIDGDKVGAKQVDTPGGLFFICRRISKPATAIAL